MSNDRPESRDEALARAVSRLSAREAYAYTIWKGTDKPLIGSTLNAQLFQLYINGKSTEEIRRLNPQLGLGEVVAAKVEGRWDDHKDDYLQKLNEGTAGRILQSTLETADFLCDALAVIRKKFGDRFQRYLQTGDEKELGDIKLENFTQLKGVVESMQKLVGHDQKPGLVLPAQAAPPAQLTPAPERVVDAKEAGRVLRLLAASSTPAVEKKTKGE
jgi:hypothetical protein